MYEHIIAIVESIHLAVLRNISSNLYWAYTLYISVSTFNFAANNPNYYITV